MLKKTSLLCGGLFLVFVMFYFPRALEIRRPETSDLVIGIALTADHGTVSLRNEDGSFTDLGRIEGSLEYTKLMRRLASQESWHLRYVRSVGRRADLSRRTLIHQAILTVLWTICGMIGLVRYYDPLGRALAFQHRQRWLS
jgi:hypothetical protein